MSETAEASGSDADDVREIPVRRPGEGEPAEERADAASGESPDEPERVEHEERAGLAEEPADRPIRSARDIARERADRLAREAEATPSDEEAGAGEDDAADEDDGGERSVEEVLEEVPEDVSVEEADDELLRTLAGNAAEYLDLLRRERAEFANYQRRMRREAPRRAERARKPLILGIIDGIDDLERALESAEDPDDALVVGVRQVREKLLDLLGEFEVRPFEVEPGEPLDPSRHEALSTHPTDEVEPGRIVSVWQTGYLGPEDTLLRPARVTVAAEPSSGETSG